jgi:uncharacterized damage-inducible protein DinB
MSGRPECADGHCRPTIVGSAIGRRTGHTLRPMTEDRRMSRTPREPTKNGPGAAQRWADYLDWMREDIIDGVLGLPASEQTTSRLPSGWSPIELLSHLLHMEQRWFVWGFLGEHVPDPWGDWNVDDPSVHSGSGGITPAWKVAEGVAAEDIATTLRYMGQRTRDTLSTHRLDQRARIGGRFTDDPPTLEWICFHVLAEYARHAGQFDVVRELSAVR